MKLIDYIDYHIAEKILDDLLDLFEKNNIFNTSIKKKYNKNKTKIVTSLLKNIEKKNTLEGLGNILLTKDTQFNNISGFKKAYQGAGKLHTTFIPTKKPNKQFETIYDFMNLNESKMRDMWHHDLLKVIDNVLHRHNSNHLDYIVTSLNEEYHDYFVTGKEDEFVTVLKDVSNNLLSTKNSKKIEKIKFLGKIIKPIGINNKCSDNEMVQSIKHRVFQLDKKFLLVNIHTAANMNGVRASDKIIELLESLIIKYNNFKIIIGGDSNIYYGKVDKKGKGGVDDINYFMTKLKKIGYKLVISKHITAKYRPANFFQNSQSATKSDEWTNEETMFISYPEEFNINYDKKHYINVEKKVKITDFHKNFSYAFIGTKKQNNINDLNEHRASINYTNFYKKLYSDHVPIYIDIEYNTKNYRIIVSNNLSINSSRGINNNVKSFKIKDVQKLESISKNAVTDFYINTVENFYKKLEINIEPHENKQTHLKYLFKLNGDILNTKSKKNNTKSKKNNTKSKKNNTKSKKNIKTLFQKHWDNNNACISLQ